MSESICQCCDLTHPIQVLFVFFAHPLTQDGRVRGRDLRGPQLDGLVDVLLRGHPAGGEGPVRQAGGRVEGDEPELVDLRVHVVSVPEACSHRTIHGVSTK